MSDLLATLKAAYDDGFISVGDTANADPLGRLIHEVIVESEKEADAERDARQRTVDRLVELQCDLNRAINALSVDPYWDLAGIGWHDCGDGVLLGSVAIGGVGHHVTAIQVHIHDCEQKTVYAEAQEQYDRLHAAFDGDGGCTVVTMRGAEYVLFVGPYS